MRLSRCPSLQPAAESPSHEPNFRCRFFDLFAKEKQGMILTFSLFSSATCLLLLIIMSMLSRTIYSLTLRPGRLLFSYSSRKVSTEIKKSHHLTFLITPPIYSRTLHDSTVVADQSTSNKMPRCRTTLEELGPKGDFRRSDASWRRWISRGT
jgi:hypothetical protein